MDALATSQVDNVEAYPYTDFSALQFPPQFAADCLGISPQTLKNIEKENNLQIGRIARGSVEVRSYTLNDLFQIAAIRRQNGQIKGFTRPITICDYVQKGGTAKTTTTCNLAILFSLMGLRTLVIDNDPQGDASSMFGYDPDLTVEELEEIGVPGERSVNGHLGNLMRLGNAYQPMTLDEVIKKPFGEHGPHLIPAEDSLDDLDVVLRNAQGSDFRYSLFISSARNGEYPHCDLSRYDVIIMDNAPSGTMLSRNSMVAADFLICPVRMDKFSFRALSRLAFKLAEFKKDFKRAPEIIAIPTMYIRNRPRIQANLARLAHLFPNKVTEQPLYLSEDYSKSLEDGVPLSLWRPATDNSLGAMRLVFSEITGRIRKVLELVK
ncbi:chromosome partitioning protein ParA [Pseudomonas asuensis]|jgi:chromosome partitioning protein|uniref:Chromosome partitioning protein ParA n=1 Tax=Pseudomonas asuensis TaxID=1825787 RepID=A0ABQ2H4L5_9PSED|nr:ParA family protein [Pseudomonas asuensis]GGM31021.1 chromosome partitioning protein ParA [Pseudomonas asuensis]